MQITRKLIDAAKNAGVDAVKFQKRTIDRVYTKEMLDAPRESPWGKTQRDQKRGLEFGQKEYDEINAYCKKVGIEWFASAWDLESQEFLRQFNLKHNKIASAMIIYPEFLKTVAKEGRHTFISTGMSNYEMIDQAVKIFREARCSFELMHCTSTYPMKDPVEVNLNCIKTLRERYECKVGYSGHEVGLSISVAAAALGITSLERHITLDRAMYGSDQAASVEPHGFKNLVESVRVIGIAMGDGVKRIFESEVPIAKKLREKNPLM
jgi:N-acetylneuraminate synthase